MGYTMIKEGKLMIKSDIKFLTLKRLSAFRCGRLKDSKSINKSFTLSTNYQYMATNDLCKITLNSLTRISLIYDLSYNTI